MEEESRVTVLRAKQRTGNGFQAPNENLAASMTRVIPSFLSDPGELI